MAVEQNFTIRRGRTSTIVVTVTGISTWTGLVAKLFASENFEDSSPTLVLTGTVDAVLNTVTFALTNAATKDITVTQLYYEITIYKADKSYLKDSNYGLIYIAPVVKEDPTI